MPETVTVLIRSAVAYLVLLLLARMMGKKLLSHLTFFDYVVGITIGSIAAVVSVDLEQATMASLSSMALWAVLTVVIGWLSTRSVTFNKLVQGEPTVLIRDGRVLERNMYKERYNLEDLLMQLREQKVHRLDDVEVALLEPNGQLSVMLKGDREPLTARAVGIRVPDQEMPTVVIWDGQVMHDSLRSIGKDRPWLERELARQGVRRVEDVFIAQYDPRDGLWVDLYADRVRPHRPETRKLLLANLLRLQADMESFALDTADPDARRLFGDLAREAGRMRERLEPLLR